MRAVIQRVKFARVVIDREMERTIGPGLLILLGVELLDTEEDAEWLAAKIARLRIFDDQEDKMNLSIEEVRGEMMVISQFTLFASTKKGNRPSWIRAAEPEFAAMMYNLFINKIQFFTKKPIVTGTFGARMEVALLNDGPVTLIIDTKQKE